MYVSMNDVDTSLMWVHMYVVLKDKCIKYSYTLKQIPPTAFFVFIMSLGGTMALADEFQYDKCVNRLTTI